MLERRHHSAERSVISAPLLRDDRRDYLGFLSVHDILCALITHMFPPGPCGYAGSTEAPEWFLLDSSPESAKRILGILMGKGEGFCNQTLGHVRRGPKGGDGAWMLDGRDCGVNVDNHNPTLLDLIQHQFLPESRVSIQGSGSTHSYPPLNHRVAIYRYTNDGPADSVPEAGAEGGGDTHGGLVEVTDVISLSDIIRFLMRWNHIEHCLTPCSIADLGLGSTLVNTIASESTLLRCFAIMKKLGVSGLGVTEPRGAAPEMPTTQASWPPSPEPVSSRLVGNISESDLRRITSDNLDVLAMSVGDFIAKLHAPPGGIVRVKISWLSG